MRIMMDTQLKTDLSSIAGKRFVLFLHKVIVLNIAGYIYPLQGRVINSVFSNVGY